MIKWSSLILFYREKYIFSFFNTSLLLFVAASVLVFSKYQPTLEVATLHYNIFYGIDQVGDWYIPFFYLAAVGLVIIINFLFAYNVFTKDKYMSYYLNVAATVVTLFFLIYVGLITP